MAEKLKNDEEKLQALQSQLQQHESGKPDAYESSWEQQIGAVLDKILNREGFSYDVNADALYSRYADTYARQGQQAMKNAYGQAAALTGGYGNSYAQTAARQAYDSSQQQLQDMIPALYELAMERYRLEGDNLHSALSLLQQQENQSYSRYQDALSGWRSDRQQLADSYQDAYNRYRDSRDYAYQQERDKVADQQWKKEFDEAVRQFNQKLWR